MYYPTGRFPTSAISRPRGVWTSTQLGHDDCTPRFQGLQTGSWTTLLSNPHPPYYSILHFDPEFAKILLIRFKSALFDHRPAHDLACVRYQVQGSSIELASRHFAYRGNARCDDFTGRSRYQALIRRDSRECGLGLHPRRLRHLEPRSDNGFLLTRNLAPRRARMRRRPRPFLQVPRMAVALAQQQVLAASSKRPCQLPKTRISSRASTAVCCRTFPIPVVSVQRDWTYVTKKKNPMYQRYRHPGMLALPLHEARFNGQHTYKAPVLCV